MQERKQIMHSPYAQSDWLTVIEDLGPTFAESIEARDAADAFGTDLYPLLKQRGVISAMVPAELGGGDATHSTMVTMLRSLARYDSSTALALSMHQHLVAAQVFNHQHGRPAPVLSRVAGEHIVLVSTGARDWLESTGEVERVEGGYRVSARKAFASGSPIGDVAVTSAPYCDPEAGWQVLHFAVPLKAEGVRIEDDWRAHGMRASGSHTLVFDGVFVPEGAITLRRPRGEFHAIWDLVIGVALPLIGAVYVGIAERAVELAVPFAGRRSQAPDVQWAIGESRSAAWVASALLDRMVALTDDFRFTPSVDLTSEMLALKAQLVEECRHAVEAAIEASGGPGYFRRTGLERLLRDVRAGDFHPLPRKQQLSFTGRHALGLHPVDVPAVDAPAAMPAREPFEVS
jgi:acyl-CoA dehydrogenase